MAQQDYRPDFSANRRDYPDDGSGGFGATWFIVAGLVLAAVLIYLVYAGGEVTAPIADAANPPTLLAPAN